MTGLERCLVLGLPTLNWDVHLRLDDGTATVVEGDEVPPYAWWLARPGAVLPVAVDPGDSSKVVVDWAQATVAASARGVDLHDRPPDRSIGASVMASAPTPVTAIDAGPADPVSIVAAHRDEAMVSGTLRAWVGEVEAGRMKPKAFRKYVAEWEAAGLCTAQEAAAARAAAGVEP